MRRNAPIKRLFRMKRRSIDPQELGDKQVFHYSLPAWHEIGDGRFESAFDIASAKIHVSGGEILVSKLNPEKGAVIHTIPRDAITVCSTEFIVLEPLKDKVVGRFAYYLMLSSHVRYILEANAESVTNSHKRTSVERFLSAKVTLPDLETQRRISNFLDRETARIDELIEKKAFCAKLLDEKWSASVRTAVTRGIQYRGPMKRVEVDSIGEVPAHWKVIKMSHGFTYIGSGMTPRSDDHQYYDGEIPWVNTSELRETTIIDTSRKLSELALRDYPTLKIYPPGTLLAAMYGATVGRLGILGVPAAVNQACLAFVGPRFLNANFTFYWLLMMRPELVAAATGGGQPNLDQGYFRQLRIPAPPLEEQENIALYLDKMKDRYDDLKKGILESVTKLHELRSALITAAVTGQIDIDTWRRRGEMERRIDELEAEAAGA